MRDSIVLFDAAIGAGAVVDRAVIDKEVVIGPSAYIGFGDDLAPNETEPGRLNTGITLVGKRAQVPYGVRIGPQLPHRPRRRRHRLHARRPAERHDRHAPPHRAVSLKVVPRRRRGGAVLEGGRSGRRRRLAAAGAGARSASTCRHRDARATAAPTSAAPATASPAASGATRIHVHRGQLDAVEVDLIECPELFDRPQIYGADDDGDRFALLARAGLAIAEDWGADIVHAHDWHGALAPILAARPDHGADDPQPRLPGPPAAGLRGAARAAPSRRCPATTGPRPSTCSVAASPPPRPSPRSAPPTRGRSRGPELGYGLEGLLAGPRCPRHRERHRRRAVRPGHRSPR